MSSIAIGETVVNFWTILDTNGAPLTGITSPSGITFSLHRQSGVTMVAASETVTMVEIGVTGSYYITYTPANLGLYVLQLQEVSALTNLRAYRFPDTDIVSAGSVFAPSYVNAYCAETDIERWVQTTISSTSRPSSSEASGFAEMRASVLSSLCARLGYSVTPLTVASGSRLEDLLREANAIGAALDYTVAQQYAKSPSLSERAERLMALWDTYFGTIEAEGFISIEIKGNLASLATDHILSGDTLAYPSGAAPTSLPIGSTMGDLY